MTPTTETIAYRIWGYASPREWDCTPADVADALDIPRCVFDHPHQRLDRTLSQHADRPDQRNHGVRHDERL